MSCLVLAPEATADSLNLGGAGCADDTRTKARVLAALRERFLLESPRTPVVDVIFEDLESVLGEETDDPWQSPTCWTNCWRTFPEQGWTLLCNRVLLFEDTGELLPDGQIITPSRPMTAGLAGHPGGA